MKKIIINNLLIILIFFFIFELSIRFFELADLRGHGEELLKKQKNVETIVFGKKVFLDEYGYRVPDNKYTYKENQNKIIFIGDSVLFGSGVNEEETFIGKLRKNFQNATFINASIIGNDIEENLIDIKKNYNIFNSDDFFLVLTLDDIVNNKTKKSDNKENAKNKSFISKLKENYFLNKINFFLRTKSYTYLWIKGIATKPSERYFFESFDNYKKNLALNFFSEKIEKIKIFGKDKNLNINFIILPYEYQVKNDCKSVLMLPQKKILSILKNKELKYINLTKVFCDQYKSKKLFLNFDPVHLSIEGHDLVFKSIENNFN